MGHQQESADISQLKAIALSTYETPTAFGANSDISRGVPTQSSLQALQARAATATNNLSRRHSKNGDTTATWKRCNDMQARLSGDEGRRGSHGGRLSSGPSKVKMHSNNTPSDGDTQVASQWVYEDRDVSGTGPGSAYTNENDTGRINIVDGFEQHVEAGEESALLVEENEDDDVELVSQDIRIEPFPESRRFQQPMTPLVTGTKRKRPSQEETPQFHSPRLPTNPFAGMGTSDMMRPSQIFHATQAQTSPLIMHSDSLSERPSPNMNNLGRPCTAASLSSPVVARDPRSVMARAVTEPQGNYVSMKESQDARERRLKRTVMKPIDPFEEEFEQRSPKQVACGVDQDKNLGSGRDDRSARRLPALSRRSMDVQGKDVLLPEQLPRISRDQPNEVVLISDDLRHEDSMGNITEDETEHEEEKEHRSIRDDIDELAEDNKENVEVPMTISRHHHGQMVVSQASPSRNRARRGLKRSIVQSATQVAGSPHRTTSPPGDPLSESGTQPYAVRDSQSSQPHGKMIPPGKLAPYQPDSSLAASNIIPQSPALPSSKSEVLPSTSLSRAETTSSTNQLIPSSPLQATQLRLRAHESDIPHTDNRPGFVLENDEYRRPSDENSQCHPVMLSEQDLSITKSKGDQTELSEKPVMKHTIPETSSTAMGINTHNIVPDSSLALGSSGPTASSGPKQSSKGQSLEKTMYETAPEHPSASASKSHMNRVQALSQGTNPSSPNKKLRNRTLGKITADPSPPDATEDINLSDFGLLNKDDEIFHRTVYGSAQLLVRPGRRQATTSTKWKTSRFDPPFDQPGSPSRPTSSAISVPTPVRLSPESESRPPSSSPLSTPPDSDHDGQHPSSGLEDVPALPDPQIMSSDDELAAIPARAPTASGIAIQKSRASSRTNKQVDTSHTKDRIIPETKHTPSLGSKVIDGTFEASLRLPVVAPNRVFAHFNGNLSAFYSATCLGVIPGDEPRYNVHYDDGAEDCISGFGIKRLEFRPGDVVKVDLAAHRATNYVVVSMEERQKVEDKDTLSQLRKSNPNERTAWPETDIFGHSKVLLAPKRAPSTATVGEEISVEISHIYLTQALWTNIKDREYVHVNRKSKTPNQAHTPASHQSAPSSPSSRLKRSKISSSFPAIAKGISKQGLFHKMAFTLTNIHQTTDLERTKSLILAHGGKVLEDGFDSLFHVPILHRTTSPKKSDSDRVFHPTRDAQSLGFTCLIADKHCRRAKYIQALALGIPCLATRWISDCVTKQRIVPWSAYLLPAGDSTFLGGATHSRVLPAFSAETSSLCHLLDQRPPILKDTSILLIMTKSEEESMRQYPLLTFALKPNRVARALSIEAAAKAVVEAQAVGEPWDWVFSYDREREVERILFGNTAKKRRNRAGNGGQEVKTRVIGNEFIIQSLISGQLIEE